MLALSDPTLVVKELHKGSGIARSEEIVDLRRTRAASFASVATVSGRSLSRNYSVCAVCDVKRNALSPRLSISP